MRWVTFDDQKDGDLIISGEERYFVADVGEGRRAVVPARCSHRGGPMYMGKSVRDKSCIQCTWHNMQTSTKVLARRSIPSARIGSFWTALLPSGISGSTVVVMPKPAEGADQLFRTHSQ